VGVTRDFYCDAAATDGGALKVDVAIIDDFFCRARQLVRLG
jgi:hypothetical protein